MSWRQIKHDVPDIPTSTWTRRRMTLPCPRVVNYTWWLWSMKCNFIVWLWPTKCKWKWSVSSLGENLYFLALTVHHTFTCYGKCIGLYWWGFMKADCLGELLNFQQIFHSDKLFFLSHQDLRISYYGTITQIILTGSTVRSQKWWEWGAGIVDREV